MLVYFKTVGWRAITRQNAFKYHMNIHNFPMMVSYHGSSSFLFVPCLQGKFLLLFIGYCGDRPAGAGNRPPVGDGPQRCRPGVTQATLGRADLQWRRLGPGHSLT